MSDTRHQPYWLARVPKKRRPQYPRYRGHVRVDVAVMGGGLVGCLAAQAFAAAGVRVALFDAGVIGEGSTAGSAGLVLHEPQATFPELAATHGLHVARRLWTMNRRGALELGALLRRLRARCELTREDAIQLALTAEEAGRLKRAAGAAKAAGFDLAWLATRAVRAETNTAAVGGLRSRANARIDPYAAGVSIAAAAARRGAAVFQGSPVVRVRPGRKAVELTLERGTVEAEVAVVATGLPGREHGQVRRHVTPMETYAAMTPPLPAAIARQLWRRPAMLRDLAAPPHHLRRTTDGHLIVAGADQKAPPARLHERTLTQRTGQLMYELSLIYPAISGIQPVYSWSAAYGRTPDGLPLVGPHRNYPRQLFALGFGTHSLGLAALAARILVRHYTGTLARGDELLGFGRLAR